ncbi:MAG: TIGR03936 family radical SAM-associated protein [Hespellia sp.]|nr:TIGR03936 family radical SAM-associated protein [Hespellia sp.]
MKVRVKFKKNGAVRYIGHLDFMRYFQKAMRRAQIPISFSGGYSPHMIMSFANPLGVGVTTDGDYFDIEIKHPISSEAAVSQLNQVMVEGVEVLSFLEIAESKKMAGMAIVAGADYLCTIKKGKLPEDWKYQLMPFFSQKEICIVKKTKRSEKEVDIRPMIYNISAEDDGIFMQLAAGSAANLKPGLVMEAFCEYLGVEKDTIAFHTHRLENYADMGENDTRNLVTLESLGTVITV